LQVSPAAHWPLLEHGAAVVPFGLHAPPSQTVPAAQSKSPAQLVAQAPPDPHMYMPQLLVTAAPQAPAPSQLAAAVCVALLGPFMQLALRQMVSAAGNVQALAFAAVHCPAQPVPAPAHPGRIPCGLPAVTGLQVPRAALVSHARHCSVHGVLQQTPSAQKPDWHSRSTSQACPLARSGTHAPSSQVLPSVQPVSSSQTSGHAAPTPWQRYGAQAGVPGVPDW